MIRYVREGEKEREEEEEEEEGRRRVQWVEMKFIRRFINDSSMRSSRSADK